MLVLVFATHLEVWDYSLVRIYTSPKLEFPNIKYFFNLASKESRRSTAKDSVEVALADENGNHQILTVQFSVDLRNNTEGGFLERRLELKNSSITEVKLLAKPVNSGVVSAMGISSFFGGSIKFLVGDSAGNLHIYDGVTLKKSAKVSDMSIMSLTVGAGTAYFISRQGLHTAERSFGSWKHESSQPSQECTPFLGDSEAFSMIIIGGQPQHMVLASNREAYIAATHTMTKGCPSRLYIKARHDQAHDQRINWLHRQSRQHLECHMASHDFRYQNLNNKLLVISNSRFISSMGQGILHKDSMGSIQTVRRVLKFRQESAQCFGHISLR